MKIRKQKGAVVMNKMQIMLSNVQDVREFVNIVIMIDFKLNVDIVNM